MSDNKVYDIIIVGAGPAGMTAAVYALRAGKTVLVIERGAFGGQMTFSPKIENFPGTVSISGNELADRMVEQVLNLGGEFELQEVTQIRDDDGNKTVVTNEGEYSCRAVIIANGARHRMLGLTGEDELVGNGISFCAVCDGAFYRDKEVAVIGGGNSALQETLLLADVCKKVTVVQNLPELTGEGRLADAVKAARNVEVIYDTIVESYITDDNFRGINLKNTATGKMSALFCDGIFIAIGLIPENSSFAPLAVLDESGYFDTDETCLTKTPGVFVAGDCRKKKIRQVTTAAADGSVAALAACRYTDNK